MKLDLEPPQPHLVAHSNPLASAWQKYNRGVAHFMSLRTAARAHMKATSDDATIDQRRLDPLTIAFYARLPLVDPEIGALVGDVAHGLRTALDHAAWAVATTRHRRVAFPICDEPKTFEELRADLAGFHSEAAIAAFERVQPYHDRPGLSWIRDINNVDKHEALVVVRHRLEVTRMLVTDSLTGEVRLDSTTREQPGPIDVKDGEPILTLKQEVPGQPRLKIAVDLQNSLALAQGRSWPQDRLDLILRQAMFDVEECLLALQDFVDASGSPSGPAQPEGSPDKARSADQSAPSASTPDVASPIQAEKRSRLAVLTGATFLHTLSIATGVLAAVFMALGSFTVTPEALRAIAGTYFDYNQALLYDLAKQTALARVGVILTMLSTVFEVRALRSNRAGGDGFAGVILAAVVTVAIGAGAWLLAEAWGRGLATRAEAVVPAVGSPR